MFILHELDCFYACRVWECESSILHNKVPFFMIKESNHTNCCGTFETKIQLTLVICFEEKYDV